jgi:hypothetical protein
MINFLIDLFFVLLACGLVMSWFDEPPGPGDL